MAKRRSKRLDKLFDGNIKTTVAGSVACGSAREAVMTQLEAGIDCLSDGQPYIFGQNINSPFFQRTDGEGLAKAIEIKGFNVHIKSKFAEVSEEEIKVSKPVDNYHRVIDVMEKVASKSEKGEFVFSEIPRFIKFVCNMPLMLLDCISDLGPYDKIEFLHDSWEFLLRPIIDAVVEKHPPDIVHAFDPAIFGYAGPHKENVHEKSVVKAELEIIDEIGKYSEKKGIPLLLDAWRPLTELDNEIREKLFGLDGIHVMSFNFLYESDRALINDLRGKYVSLGIISNKAMVETVAMIKEKLTNAVDKFGKHRLMISPEKPILSLDGPRVRAKLTNMVKARDEMLSRG